MSLNLKIITTKDGSNSLFNRELNEIYHSIHGAISESMHVFIKNGVKKHKNKNISILEIGFGTGLNAILTLGNLDDKNIEYTTLEPYPITKEIYHKLNFYKYSNIKKDEYLKIHECEWGRKIAISKRFTIIKLIEKIGDFATKDKFNIIYFDAFAPNKQKEMWTREILEKCFNLLRNNGFLVTYCSKGYVKRLLQEIGFNVKNLPGPPGKREMIQAFLN